MATPPPPPPALAPIRVAALGSPAGDSGTDSAVGVGALATSPSEAAAAVASPPASPDDSSSAANGTAAAPAAPPPYEDVELPDGSRYRLWFPWEMANADYLRRVLDSVRDALHVLIALAVVEHAVPPPNSLPEAQWDAYGLLKHLEHADTLAAFLAFIGVDAGAHERDLAAAVHVLMDARNRLFAHRTAHVKLPGAAVEAHFAVAVRFLRTLVTAGTGAAAWRGPLAGFALRNLSSLATQYAAHTASRRARKAAWLAAHPGDEEPPRGGTNGGDDGSELEGGGTGGGSSGGGGAGATPAVPPPPTPTPIVVSNWPTLLPPKGTGRAQPASRSSSRSPRSGGMGAAAADPGPGQQTPPLAPALPPLQLSAWVDSAPLPPQAQSQQQQQQRSMSTGRGGGRSPRQAVGDDGGGGGGGGGGRGRRGSASWPRDGDGVRSPHTQERLLQQFTLLAEPQQPHPPERRRASFSEGYSSLPTSAVAPPVLPHPHHAPSHLRLVQQQQQQQPHNGATAYDPGTDSPAAAVHGGSSSGRAVADDGGPHAPLAHGRPRSGSRQAVSEAPPFPHGAAAGRSPHHHHQQQQADPPPPRYPHEAPHGRTSPRLQAAPPPQQQHHHHGGGSGAGAVPDGAGDFFLDDPAVLLRARLHHHDTSHGGGNGGGPGPVYRSPRELPDDGGAADLDGADVA
jgi:hypothetical protein